MSLGDIHFGKECEVRLGQYKSMLEQTVEKQAAKIQQLQQQNQEMLGMLLDMRGIITTVSNMLERDNTPARKEIAKDMREAFGALITKIEKGE